MRHALYLTLTTLAALAAPAFLRTRPRGMAPESRRRVKSAAHPATVAPDAEVARLVGLRIREPRLSRAAGIALLRKRVRYVFVLYQENRSFDSYFGTFPGAEGLFSHPASETPGFDQPLIGADGASRTIHPFRIGPKEYAADTDDIDHSHSGIVRKMHGVDGVPRMDRFAEEEEKKHYKPGAPPTLEAEQFGELAMAYLDGDTIPLLWRYANRFVLFDHIFQQMTGPSTPGNLAILGAQTGATQWMRHPELRYQGNGDSGAGVPVMNDALPFWGSPSDAARILPHPFMPPLSYGKPKLDYKIQDNLTYATLPLTLAGRAAGAAVRDDPRREDLDDVREDLADLGRSGKPAVPWDWYQEGYDREPTDPSGADPVDAAGLHASYITHHNGPQYFGYIANSRTMSGSLHGLNDLFTALDRRTLPAAGGVFYVKGGYRNLMKLAPVDPDPKVRKLFLGDDDHPAYSDAQISEALVAETINRIASSPYWKRCAIVITWDDSEGDYDHVPPPVRGVGPDGAVVTDGPRVPLLLISPFARVHTVAHDAGDHASVVKLIDAVFGLKPLADLPDEVEGRRIGERQGLANQGPYDDLTPGITDLLSGFDPARLAGRAAALPASYARVPERLVRTLPKRLGYGWRQVGVEPVDYRLGIANAIPQGFNPRPRTDPGPGTGD